ncbi:GAF domain-containing protein [Sphingomonas montanisoli]|nr:GAF domain-containing protein [Sphingomonas montanisoli]
MASVSVNGDVADVLRELCDLTGMGFAAVAGMTEERWMALQVYDRIEFGLNAGDELDIAATICNEIRESGRPIYIDSVRDAPKWRDHPVPATYGFQSYVSVPLFRMDRSVYGTMFAVDPKPHVIDTPEVRKSIVLLAARLMTFLYPDAI